MSLASQSDIYNIRVHEFKSKTRMVLDFSTIMKKFYITENNRNNTTITIENSTINDEAIREISLSKSYWASIKQNNNNIELNINVSKNKISTFTLDEPSRLVIDINISGKQTPISNLSLKVFKEIRPGITYKKYYLKGPKVVNILDIDLNDPLINLMPVSANNNNILSKKNVNQMLYYHKALAGINASFFKPPSGLPLGALIIDNKIHTGSIYDRVALVIDKDNTAHLDKIRFIGTVRLENGTIIGLQNINQPRLSVDGFMLYSDKWINSVPKTLKNEIQLAIVNGKVVNKTYGSIKVPANGYVVTGPSKNLLEKINIGEKIEIKYNISSKIDNIKHAIGGGPYLLKDGKVFIDCISEKFNFNEHHKDPRTAVAITADNHLLLVTVDGRQSYSIGMSFYELAQFLKTIGAINAMNFDGGSSTQMSIMGKLVNSPTVRGGALVSTAIIVKEKDNITIANKKP